METITRVNGNGKKYTTGLPLLIIQENNINDVALKHIKENTGLEFKKTHYGYTAQPENSNQIASLFMTYNYKTKYFNNGDYSNALMLRSDYNTGFNVRHVCYDCCKANNINVNNMQQQDRLNC
jgi:urate oxidase